MEENRGGDILGSLRDYLLFLAESGMVEISRSGNRGSGIRAKSAETVSVVDSAGMTANLEAVRRELGDCKRCGLAETRQQIVFGEGDLKAKILFIGEGPGEEEDRTGRPFVGKAGQLLTDIIEKAMKISRSSVYICNIVKCRPPGNRTPHDDEMALCLPFLRKQIAAIGPTVIVTLGRSAACALLGIDEPMGRLRGVWHAYEGIPVMPTFHPSYVLRRYTVEVRKQVYEDCLEVLKRLEPE